jgi:hypothetical protein
MNKINAVLMLYLNGVLLLQLLQQQILKKTERNAKDLVNSVLRNYHLIVRMIGVTTFVLAIVELFRIVLMKKLMELGILQYVKM